MRSGAGARKAKIARNARPVATGVGAHGGAPAIAPRVARGRARGIRGTVRPPKTASAQVLHGVRGPSEAKVACGARAVAIPVSSHRAFSAKGARSTGARAVCRSQAGGIAKVPSATTTAAIVSDLTHVGAVVAEFARTGWRLVGRSGGAEKTQRAGRAGSRSIISTRTARGVATRRSKREKEKPEVHGKSCGAPLSEEEGGEEGRGEERRGSTTYCFYY